MHRTRKALIPVTIMLIFISLFPAIEGDGESSTYELDFPEIKVTKERITTWLGEGDFIGIRNQDRDAMIGVLFGTQENPNYIYIISVWTRYLGVGDVYDEDGKLLKKGHPIPVRTMFAQRFGNMIPMATVSSTVVKRRVRPMRMKQGNRYSRGLLFTPHGRPRRSRRKKRVQARRNGLSRSLPRVSSTGNLLVLCRWIGTGAWMR